MRDCCLTANNRTNISVYLNDDVIKSFSALLSLCEGNPPVTGGFPSQRPVTRSFDVFFVFAWTNGWANNWDTGDLRRHHAYHDVTVAPSRVAPGNPTLWRGVPVASIQKSFGSSGRDWKQWKKLPIPCKCCTYRFIRYSSTCYGKVRINPLMANIRNPDLFASPVANAAWFVVVRPCYPNRDLLSGPKGN